MIVRNEKPQGMYSNYLNPHSGTFAAQHSSVGALGDSFYEYLFKEWQRSAANDTEALALFDSSQQAIFTNMLRRTKAGFLYAAEWKPHALEHKMDHLGTCIRILTLTSTVLLYCSAVAILVSSCTSTFSCTLPACNAVPGSGVRISCSYCACFSLVLLVF